MRFFNKRKTENITIKSSQITNMVKQQQMHDSALVNSIVLVGPQDVGKSVLAKNFAKRHGLLYVNMQEARYCSIDKNTIKSSVSLYSDYSKQSKMEARNSVARRYAQFANIERANLAYREAFPDVPNYITLGYNSKLLELLQTIDSFNEDDVCTYMYKKQFDDAIIKAVAQTITVPCVIDMTTEGPIRLTKEYLKRLPVVLADYEKGKNTQYKDLTLFLKSNSLSINQVLSLPKENDTDVLNAIRSFNNIVCLKYPLGKTPKLDYINQHFLNSGQYEKLANNNTVVADFIGQDEHGCSVLNKQKLTECMDIMASYIYDHNPDIYKTQKEIEIAF